MNSLDSLVQELCSEKQFYLVLGEKQSAHDPYACTGKIVYLEEGQENAKARVAKISLLGLEPEKRYHLKEVAANIDRHRRINGYEGAVLVQAKIEGKDACIVAYPPQK